MSIRQGLLALLSQQPMYGAQLRTEFDRRTGGTWPLNVGQVYTTLARLQRDGYVEGDGRPDDEGRIAYRLTEAGHAEVALWFASPVSRDADPRDELTIKLALAVTMPDVDVVTIISNQRMATVRQLQQYTGLKRRSSEAEAQAGELAWQLVLERSIFSAEAQVRWLDHVEARVRRAAADVDPASVTGDHRDAASLSSQVRS